MYLIQGWTSAVRVGHLANTPREKDKKMHAKIRTCARFHFECLQRLPSISEILESSVSVNVARHVLLSATRCAARWRYVRHKWMRLDSTMSADSRNRADWSALRKGCLKRRHRRWLHTVDKTVYTHSDTRLTATDVLHMWMMNLICNSNL